MQYIDPELFDIIEEMMYEFMDSKPQTHKDFGDQARGLEATFHRLPTVQNPEWYRNMCSDFPRPIQPSNPRPKRKKPRTIVKRKDTIKLFGWILKNGSSGSKYASYIVDEAQRRLETYSSVEENEAPF